MKRVILAFAVLAGLTGAVLVSAGVTATYAVACDSGHTS